MASAKKVTPKKASDLMSKSQDELQTELINAQTELVETKRSHAARELSNTGRLRELRVLIAQIKTALAAKRKEEEKV